MRAFATVSTYNKGVWRIDYARVQLAKARPFPLKGLTINSKAGRLALRWHGGAPRAAHLLCIALYDAKRGESCILAAPLTPGSTTATMKLPQGWGSRALHAWLILEDGQGKILYTSHYIPLPGAIITTTTRVPGGVTSTTTNQPGGAIAAIGVVSIPPRTPT